MVAYRMNHPHRIATMDCAVSAAPERNVVHCQSLDQIGTARRRLPRFPHQSRGDGLASGRRLSDPTSVFCNRSSSEITSRDKRVLVRGIDSLSSIE
jgi:hypothetical protein